MKVSVTYRGSSLAPSQRIHRVYRQRGVRIVTATFHLDTARWCTVREDVSAKVRLVEVR